MVKESLTPEVLEIASTAEDYRAFGDLVSEYVGWSRVRYHEHPWFVDKVFGHQSLQDELKDLSVSYGPPRGKTLLARHNGVVCGGVAYRSLSEDICEMKRLFVTNQHKGHGTGRKLCEAIISLAKRDGYRLMRLDTGRLMQEAIQMYHSFGFRECAPYHEYPADLMSFLVFMELPLTGTS
jgi:GNAT superfamily N-acetyltransferase